MPTHDLGKQLKRRFGITEIGFTPDAYRLEDAKQILRLFEVIVSHPLTPAKLSRIRVLAADLDAYGWRLRLVGCGSDRVYRNLDMDTGLPIITMREMQWCVKDLDTPFHNFYSRNPRLQAMKAKP